MGIVRPFLLGKEIGHPLYFKRRVALKINHLVGSYLSLIIAIGVVSVMVSCGGGGGGGGNNSGITNQPIQESLSYDGNTAKATIDESNAVELSIGAVNGGMSSSALYGISSLNNISTGTNDPILQIYFSTIAMQNAVDKLQIVSQDASGSFLAVQTEQETIYGTCGGHAIGIINGDDSNGNIWGNLTFNDYCDSNVTINGNTNISGLVNLTTGDIENLTLDFDYLTSTGVSGSSIMDGTIAIFQKTAGPSITIEMYLKDILNGNVYWINNYNMNVVDDYPNIIMNFSGTFYHPLFGYVTFSTVENLVVLSGDSVPSSGIIEMVGENGSTGGPTKAKISFHQSALLQVEADSDGDGNYDWNSGMVDWNGTQMAPPVVEEPTDNLPDSPFTVNQISHNGGTNPSNHNGAVAYEGWDNDISKLGIFYWDGNNVIKLSNEYGGYQPSAFNGTVAWLGDVGGYTQIFFWDGNTITQITTNQQYIIQNLSLYNGTMAWAQYHITDPFDRKIIYWDGTETHAIADVWQYADVEGLSLYNGCIAWSGYDDTNTNSYDIFFWDGNTTINVSNSGTPSHRPSLYNGTITWMEATSSGWEILYWDGNSINQITNNSVGDEHPSLFNGKIAWSQDTERSGIYEIMYWDGNNIIQVTDNNTTDYSPSLYDNTIAWCGTLDGNEIYYVTIE